jgi:hypothetical protein
VASYHVHVCKFVPVVRSIQGRIFVRPIHSSSAVRFNMTTFFAVRSMGHSGPSTISLHGEIYGKSQWRLQEQNSDGGSKEHDTDGCVVTTDCGNLSQRPYITFR